MEQLLIAAVAVAVVLVWRRIRRARQEVEDAGPLILPVRTGGRQPGYPPRRRR